jgi:DUF1680 family protein
MNSSIIGGPVDTTRSPFTRLTAVSANSVTLRPGFWSNVQSIIHMNSLKHAYRMLEKAGNFHNFKLAAGKARGSYRGRNFIDSDVYKWLEAVGWELGRQPDDSLRKMADEAISLVEAAQCDDGYLNCYVQTAPGAGRWVDMDHGHELYCAGHLFQAAVAFHRAVGDDRLLNVSTRFADRIYEDMGPGKQEITCGHPEVEMALIELYRVTGNAAYLETAKCLIDRRGKRKMIGFASYGPEYHQDHVPVREAVSADGHAVRQLYLASGVADLYLETGEQALLDSLQSIWKDIASSKLYITGGVGARFDGEAFGDPYELPPDQCYCETCASIAFIQWNWRMLLVTGESRFADMIERCLYNIVLGCPSLDGRHFFYANPLMVRDGKFSRLSANESDGTQVTGRPEWHGVACCPPNVMRTYASLDQIMATTSPDGLQIHQYSPMNLITRSKNGGKLSLTVETNYPYEGSVRLKVTEAHDYQGTISLRQPAWCPSTSININGEKSRVLVAENGYFLLDHEWTAGDVIDMEMTLVPTFMEANPRVDAVRDCAAIQFGPLVFCLESQDQPVNGGLQDIRVNTKKPLIPRWRSDLLGGVLTMEASGYEVDMEAWNGRLYRSANRRAEPERSEIKLTAIPYYAWANRGIASMRVWIPRLDE